MEKDKAELIVDAIIEDLSDRRGMGQEWDQLDSDMQAEIRAEWLLLARIVIDPPGRAAP